MQAVGEQAALTFRRTTRADLPRLQAWLREPHVQRYWDHETDDAALERDFGGSVDGTEPSEDFIVSEPGGPFGFIQRCRIFDYPEEHRELIELADPPTDALTIDYFIGDVAATGRGLGARMIRAFTELCWADHPAASAIVVPVTVGNIASWSALRSAGYRWSVTGYLEPDNPIDDGKHHVYRMDRPASLG